MSTGWEFLGGLPKGMRDAIYAAIKPEADKEAQRVMRSVDKLIHEHTKLLACGEYDRTMRIALLARTWHSEIKARLRVDNLNVKTLSDRLAGLEIRLIEAEKLLREAGIEVPREPEEEPPSPDIPPCKCPVCRNDPNFEQMVRYYDSD